MEDEELSLIDKSIIEMRKRPLSEETIGAIKFGGSDFKKPCVMPWFGLREMRVDGKKRIVPFVGIKGDF